LEFRIEGVRRMGTDSETGPILCWPLTLRVRIQSKHPPPAPPSFAPLDQHARGWKQVLSLCLLLVPFVELVVHGGCSHVPLVEGEVPHLLGFRV
jgi:hypothetical protein